MEVAFLKSKIAMEIDPKAAVNEALNLCDEFAEPKKSFVDCIATLFNG